MSTQRGHGEEIEKAKVYSSYRAREKERMVEADPTSPASRRTHAYSSPLLELPPLEFSPSFSSLSSPSDDEFSDSSGMSTRGPDGGGGGGEGSWWRPA